MDILGQFEGTVQNKNTNLVEGSLHLLTEEKVALVPV